MPDVRDAASDKAEPGTALGVQHEEDLVVRDREQVGEVLRGRADRCERSRPRSVSPSIARATRRTSTEAKRSRQFGDDRGGEIGEWVGRDGTAPGRLEFGLPAGSKKKTGGSFHRVAGARAASASRALIAQSRERGSAS